MKDPNQIGVIQHVCKRYPPQALLVQVQGGVNILAAFPPVAPEMAACGEYLDENMIEQDDDSMINGYDG